MAGYERMVYRGRQVRAHQVILEVLVRMLVDEMDRLVDPPAWVPAHRAEWFAVATEEWGFWALDDLDRELPDREGALLIARLARDVVARLEAMGDPISAEQLNAIGAGRPDGFFGGELPAEALLVPARALVAVLEERD
ncbi:MAG: hypothetical protein Q8S73_01535 [Deltaproteobacteria bacterium]|nr:hypothetical protein [Myxococcales bacterium]MDP3212757.1 hypothetical protein [Deltaproteobacteria bacterium]